MGRYSSARFRDDRAGLTGLPLRIFIMVVIAGVCLVAIVGFIVMKEDLDTINVEDIKIDGWSQTKIWCNWTEETNKSIFEPNRGEHWYAGAKLSNYHNPNDYLFSPSITIICKDDEGDPMSEVDVVISGAGVLDSGKTNTNGKVILSLKGCHLGPNEVVGKIQIEAKYQSTFGEQTKTTSITVLAGNTSPNQGDY